ncbi:hypothetical protein JS533_003180 [Bifidobacterium amazonense]|uniref:Uncharacterized protein n=1 Tax=Bifidobacterium amazonense TaxID=2809027 RepID=A0ABS9VT65_9BIFI|nr:hypothetical protein [Bifidobacterium amazonense]MCH9275281.1 hypothetical protein [Bifidobacterium amazonense]
MDLPHDDMMYANFAESWLLAPHPSPNGAYEPWRDGLRGARPDGGIRA